MSRIPRLDPTEEEAPVPDADAGGHGPSGALLPALALVAVVAVVAAGGGCTRGAGPEDLAPDAEEESSQEPAPPDPIELLVAELRLHEGSFAPAVDDYLQVSKRLAAGDLDEARREARYMAVTAKSGIAVHERHETDVPEAARERVARHLRRVTEAATRLAQAEALPAARDALTDLTDHLVEWQPEIDDLRSEVGAAALEVPRRSPPLVLVTCRESGERWLSAAGEPFVNPHSAERRDCGAVVAGP